MQLILTDLARSVLAAAPLYLRAKRNTFPAPHSQLHFVHLAQRLHSTCAGGYSKWLSEGLNTAPSLPKHLQGAGYNTYYVGKFLVEYALYNYRPVPDGERVFLVLGVALTASSS